MNYGFDDDVRNTQLDAASAIDALNTDAARYRWLRNSALLVDQAGAFSPYVVQGQTIRPLGGSILDRLIDLAMNTPNVEVSRSAPLLAQVGSTAGLAGTGEAKKGSGDGMRD